MVLNVASATALSSENGELYVNAMGDTVAKYDGKIVYDMFAEIRVNNKTIQQSSFAPDSGYWPDDGFTIIGTVKMQLPVPKNKEDRVSLYLSASYVFTTGYGSAVPTTSLNFFSTEASRAIKTFELNIIRK